MSCTISTSQELEKNALIAHFTLLERKTPMINKSITAIILATFVSAGAIAEEENTGPAKCPTLQASTIFVKDKTGSRKKGSASKISETHKTAESQGWDFKDLEVYIENGDLQGFFITYTRSHPCNN